MDDKNNSMTFEQALERIEAITEQLSSPKTTVDSSVALYKEASELLVLCSGLIASAKLEVDEVEI